MNETDREHLHKLYAGFAMIGLLMRGNDPRIPSASFSIADAMLEELDARTNNGIASVKRKYNKKETVNE
jgi:hypothetical protein